MLDIRDYGFIRAYRQQLGIGLWLAICATILSLLTGCAGAGGITAPGAATPLDERAAIAAEASWRAGGAVVEAVADYQLLSGSAADAAGRIDARAELAIGVLRSAYDAGNAQDYLSASLAATSAVGQLRELSTGWQLPSGSGGASGSGTWGWDAVTFMRVGLIVPVILAEASRLRETIDGLDGLPQAELQRRLAQLRRENDQARFRRVAKLTAAAGR